MCALFNFTIVKLNKAHNLSLRSQHAVFVREARAARRRVKRDSRRNLLVGLIVNVIFGSIALELVHHKNPNIMSSIILRILIPLTYGLHIF